VIKDIMAVTVRTFYPVASDYMEVNAWALSPSEESAEDSKLSLDNFLTFLGSADLQRRMMSRCSSPVSAVSLTAKSDGPYLARYETRASIDHGRVADARLLAQMEPVDDRTAIKRARKTA
jgi:hypothetical protein